MKCTLHIFIAATAEKYHLNCARPSPVRPCSTVGSSYSNGVQNPRVVGSNPTELKEIFPMSRGPHFPFRAMLAT